MKIQKAILLFGLLTATLVLIVQSILDARNLTELAIRAKIDQVESAIANKDVLNLRKILQDVTVYGFKKITLDSQQMPTVSTVPQVHSCLYRVQFEKPLLVGDTARILLCVDMRTAFVLPLMKPYFWIFSFLSFLLLYLSAYLPLMAFKKKTTEILKIEENGLTHQKQNYTDSLQLEILSRLEREYQNKIQYKISEVERFHAERLANMAIGIAHDLRSPLSVVNLVGFKLKNENLLEEHDLLKKTCTRMQNILVDFQSEARSFIKGKLQQDHDKNSKQRVEKINLKETLNDLVQQKIIEWEGSNQIFFKMDCDIEVRSFAFSKATLERHLSNLINNSIEAITSGGEIQLAVYERNSIIHFKVIDNGSGIEPAKLETLGNNITESSKKGMGYGFFAFKQFVESTGGQVTIKSKLRQGTKIEFSLPALSV